MDLVYLFVLLLLYALAHALVWAIGRLGAGT
jgi:hypothetical protein